MALHSARLPVVSYGPLRLLEAVPWLMFATAMRILAVTGGVPGFLASLCADFAVFLAFLLAARRMIELSDGTTTLGRLDFGEQLRLAWRIVMPILVAMLIAVLAASYVVPPIVAAQMLVGLDGIAFDQFTYAGQLWSAVLAAAALLMLLRAEATGSDELAIPALKELWQRSICLVPAILAVTVAQIGLSTVQGAVRVVVHAYWHVPGPPQLARTLVYFFFIFGFASIRLWMTLAILVFSLRESYRRGHAIPVARDSQDGGAGAAP